MSLLKAQEPVNNNTIASLKSRSHVETELLVVTDRQALPSAIKRAAGPFFLQVVNQTFKSDLAIIVEPTAGSRSAGPTEALASRLAARRLSRQSMLLSGEPGEYDIKAADTGTILCHLVIGEKQ